MVDKYLIGQMMTKTIGMKAFLRMASCMVRARGCSRTVELRRALL